MSVWSRTYVMNQVVSGTPVWVEQCLMMIKNTTVSTPIVARNEPLPMFRTISLAYASALAKE